VHVNVLEPVKLRAVHAWCWTEPVSNHIGVRSNQTVLIGWELLIIVAVVVSIGELSRVRIVSHLLNIDEAVSLIDKWQVRFGE